jgi:hypothetical protein
MRWEDIRDGVWHIPSEKREKGTAGELVLSYAAMVILDSLPHIDGDPKVFPYRNGLHHCGLEAAD